MSTHHLQHSIVALVEVHYKRGLPERYEVLMAPVGDGSMVCIGMHSPYAGDNRERMQPWPSDSYDSEALCAVHVLAVCTFGDAHAAPRIVGAPEWDEVSLEVVALGERKPRRLLKLELTADSADRGTCLHWDTTAVVGHEMVRICREDADPLFAITRLAMADWATAVPQQPEHHAVVSAAPLPRPIAEPALAIAGDAAALDDSAPDTALFDPAANTPVFDAELDPLADAGLPDAAAIAAVASVPARPLYAGH